MDILVSLFICLSTAMYSCHAISILTEKRLFLPHRITNKNWSLWRPSDMIFSAQKKQKADADSCYYIALVQPIIASLYILCMACELIKPSCPVWNLGQTLNSMPDMICGWNLDFMSGMKFSKFHARHEILQISCRAWNRARQLLASWGHETDFFFMPWRWFFSRMDTFLKFFMPRLRKCLLTEKFYNWNFFVFKLGMLRKKSCQCH